MEVRKALFTDFELVYPLLEEFNSSVGKDKWKRLFEKHWEGAGDYCGFIALAEGIVIGYIGVVFSEREINGNKEKFAGLSSWVVKEAYRKEFNPLTLFFKVLSLKEYTLTSFTSIPDAAQILLKLGFKEMDRSIRLIRKNKAVDKVGELYFGEDIVNFLNEKDRQIYRDHKKFNVAHVLIRSSEEYCYLIVKKQKYTANKLFLPKWVFYLHHLTKLLGYPFLLREKLYGRIYYISNKPMFVHRANNVAGLVSERLGVEGLLVNERFLGNAHIPKSLKGSWLPSLYKSKSVAAQDVDMLYSELFLLDY